MLFGNGVSGQKTEPSSIRAIGDHDGKVSDPDRYGRKRGRFTMTVPIPSSTFNVIWTVWKHRDRRASVGGPTVYYTVSNLLLSLNDQNVQSMIEEGRVDG